MLAVVAASVSWADPNAAVVEKTDEFTDRRTLQLNIVANGSGRGIGMVVLCGDRVGGRSVWFAGADVSSGDIETSSRGSEPGIFSDPDEAYEFGIHTDTETFGAFPYEEEAHVSVAYRFDSWKADKLRANWYAPERFAYFDQWRDVQDWMAMLESSDRLIVKFGRGRVDRYDLGAARPAIRDFKTRCRPAGRVETNGRFGSTE